MSNVDDPYKSLEKTSKRLEASHSQQDKLLFGIPSFNSDIHSLLSAPSPAQENSPKNTIDINMELSSNHSFSPNHSVKLDVEPNLHAYTTHNTATAVRTPVFTKPPASKSPIFEETRLISSFSRSRSNSVHSQVSSAGSADTSNTLSASDSDQGVTPPLTPDSFSASSLSSSHLQPSDSLLYPSDDDLSLGDRAHASEIKAGKRPERPIVREHITEFPTQVPLAVLRRSRR